LWKPYENISETGKSDLDEIEELGSEGNSIPHYSPDDSYQHFLGGVGDQLSGERRKRVAPSNRNSRDAKYRKIERDEESEDSPVSEDEREDGKFMKTLTCKESVIRQMRRTIQKMGTRLNEREVEFEKFRDTHQKLVEICNAFQQFNYEEGNHSAAKHLQKKLRIVEMQEMGLFPGSFDNAAYAWSDDWDMDPNNESIMPQHHYSKVKVGEEIEDGELSHMFIVLRNSNI
jgi:hypothetical protein